MRNLLATAKDMKRSNTILSSQNFYIKLEGRKSPILFLWWLKCIISQILSSIFNIYSSLRIEMSRRKKLFSFLYFIYFLSFLQFFSWVFSSVVFLLYYRRSQGFCKNQMILPWEPPLNLPSYLSSVLLLITGRFHLKKYVSCPTPILMPRKSLCLLSLMLSLFVEAGHGPWCSG